MTVIQLYDLSDPLCTSGCSSEIESYCVRAADSRGRAEQTSFWTHKPKNLTRFLSHPSSPTHTTVWFMLSPLPHLWTITVTMLSGQPRRALLPAGGSGFVPAGRTDRAQTKLSTRSAVAQPAAGQPENSLSSTTPEGRRL